MKDIKEIFNRHPGYFIPTRPASTHYLYPDLRPKAAKAAVLFNYRALLSASCML